MKSNKRKKNNLIVQIMKIGENCDESWSWLSYTALDLAWCDLKGQKRLLTWLQRSFFCNLAFKYNMNWRQEIQIVLRSGHFQAKISIKLYTKIFENYRTSLCYSTNSSRSKQTTRMLFWYRWQKIRPPRIHDFFSPVNFVFDSGIAMSLWKMDRKLASIPLEKFCVIVASRHRKVGLDFWLKIGALCLGQWVKIVSQKALILIFMHFNL